MPPTDPKYVRLADHLSTRSISDIGGRSGWSISGTEVKPFPKKPAQARYVRQKLAAGQLETASRSEFDEIERLNTRYHELVEESLGTAHQENALNDAADQARAEVLGDEDVTADDTAEDD